jgi:hypothetical protein
MADETHDLFEIMHSSRSIRRLKQDRVPDELVQKILEARTVVPRLWLHRPTVTVPRNPARN